MALEHKAADDTSAWKSCDPTAATAHFEETAQIVTNRGGLRKGTQALTDRTAGF